MSVEIVVTDDGIRVDISDDGYTTRYFRNEPAMALEQDLRWAMKMVMKLWHGPLCPDCGGDLRRIKRHTESCRFMAMLNKWGA